MTRPPSSPHTRLGPPEVTEVGGSTRSLMQAGELDSIRQANQAISALQSEFNRATTDQARSEIQNLIDKVRTYRDEMRGVKGESSEIGQVAQQAIGDAAAQGFMQLGKAIGNSQKTMASFGQATKRILGQLAVTIGKQMIAMGTPMLLTPNAAMGAAYVAAGTTLVALGSAAASSGRSGPGAGGPGGGRRQRSGSGAVPGMAEGGTVASGGLALVGERGRELVEMPEGATVHPNRTTESMLNMVKQTPPRALAGTSSGVGGGAAGDAPTDVGTEVRKALEGQELTTRVRGRDLMLVIERQQRADADAGLPSS